MLHGYCCCCCMIRRRNMIRTGYVNTSNHAGRYQYHWKIIERSNTKDTKCSLHFRTYWYMMKNPSDEEQRDGSFRCKCFKCTEPVSGILLKRESLTRCKQGRWARSRQAQLVVYALQQHSVVPGTVPCPCFFYHVSYERNRSYEKGGSIQQ